MKLLEIYILLKSIYRKYCNINTLTYVFQMVKQLYLYNNYIFVFPI